MSNSLQLHGLQPTSLLCAWDSPDKNTGVNYHFLLQGIFLTQGSNPDSLPYEPPGKCWHILQRIGFDCKTVPNLCMKQSMMTQQIIGMKRFILFKIICCNCFHRAESFVIWQFLELAQQNVQPYTWPWYKPWLSYIPWIYSHCSWKDMVEVLGTAKDR